MRIFFISGLPRSGSTLLANILAQNPDIHTAGTSGMLDVMFVVRNRWDRLIEHRAMNAQESDWRKRNVLLGILAGYHGHVNEGIVFDKSRGHLARREHRGRAEFVNGHGLIGGGGKNGLFRVGKIPGQGRGNRRLIGVVGTAAHGLTKVS